MIFVTKNTVDKRPWFPIGLHTIQYTDDPERINFFKQYPHFKVIVVFDGNSKECKQLNKQFKDKRGSIKSSIKFNKWLNGMIRISSDSGI